MLDLPSRAIGGLFLLFRLCMGTFNACSCLPSLTSILQSLSVSVSCLLAEVCHSVYALIHGVTHSLTHSVSQ